MQYFKASVWRKPFESNEMEWAQVLFQSGQDLLQTSSHESLGLTQLHFAKRLLVSALELNQELVTHKVQDSELLQLIINH